MKILVTGGCGFIGSFLLKNLLTNKKNFVLNLDKMNYASNSHLNKEFKKKKNYKFIRLDIKFKKKIEKLILQFKPNYIFHLAAESHVDRSIDASKIFIDSNIIGTFNLLESVRNLLKKKFKNFIKFHHISTDEVYGDLGKTKKKFSETTAYNPSSPYSATKASSDHLVKSWARTYGIPYLITNCSNNFGPYQFPEKFIPHAILCILQKKKIPIYGNGKQIRDWIFVEDHVQILLRLMNKKFINETYNIGTNNQISNINLLNKIFLILKKKIPLNDKFEKYYTYVSDRPGHDIRYAINLSKLKKVLKLKTEKKFLPKLEKTILWFLNNKKFWMNSFQNKYKLKRLGKL
jgi:dTDP-glucose 4,6-dehydratase